MKVVSSALAALAALAQVAAAGTIQKFSTSEGGIALRYLQVANGSNTDLRLRLSASTSSGWAATSIGHVMEGALFFIIYASSDPTKPTVSVRSSVAGHALPIRIDNLDYRIQNASIADGRMHADITCYGCTSWPGGTLQTTAVGQPWIFARGPGAPVNSDDTAAELANHNLVNGYGYFHLDHAASQFTAAEAPPSPFLPGDADVDVVDGSTDPHVVTEDADALDPNYYFMVLHIHVVLFSMAWLIFAPAAIWLLKYVSLRAHYLMQSLVLVFNIVGFGTAVWVSRLTIDYRNLDGFHQIIGIVVFSLAMIQGIGGTLQHTIFKRWKGRAQVAPSVNSDSDSTEKTAGNKTAPSDVPVPKPRILPAMSQVHMWLGRSTMILGGMNVPFGFWFITPGASIFLPYAWGVGFAGLVVVMGTLVPVGIMRWRQKRAR